MPWPCRTSAFIPTNIPVIGGMILIKPTIYTDIFFQTANQTLNVCLNIGNRNASSPQSVSEVLKNYAMAVGVSVSLILAFRRLSSGLMKGN